MFCSNCGSPIKEGGNFCPECGTKVQVPIQEAAIENPMPVQETQAYAAPPVEESPIDHTVPIQETTIEDSQSIGEGQVYNAVPLQEAPSYNTSPVQDGQVYNAAPSQEVPNNNAEPVQQEGQVYNAASTQEIPAYQAQPQEQPGGNTNVSQEGQTYYSGTQINSDMNSVPLQENQYYYNPVSEQPSQPVAASKKSKKTKEKTGKKKGGKLWLVIVLIVLLLAGGAGAAIFIFKPFGSKDPLNRLMMASVQQLKSRQFHYSTELGIQPDKENEELSQMIDAFAGEFASSNEDILNFLSAVSSKYKLQYTTFADLKSSPLKIGISAKVLYNDHVLVDAGYNLKPWEMSISSESLLSKPLYLDLAKVLEEGTGIDISDLDLSPYLDILFEEDEFIKNFAKSGYVEIMKEKLDLKSKTPKLKNMGKEKIEVGGKTITADKIRLQMTYEEMLDLSNALINEASTDPLFKKSIIGKTEKILGKMKETGDYQLLGIDEESFDEIADQAITELEDGYDGYMEMMVSLMMGSSAELDEEIEGLFDGEIVYDYYLVGNDIKNITSSLNVMGMTMTMDTDVLEVKDMDFDMPSAKKSYDFMDLINGDISEITEDVLSNVENNIIGGEAFSEMFSDIKNEARDKLNSEDADFLDMLIDEQLIPTMEGFRYMLPFY